METITIQKINFRISDRISENKDEAAFVQMLGSAVNDLPKDIIDQLEDANISIFTNYEVKDAVTTKVLGCACYTTSPLIPVSRDLTIIIPEFWEKVKCKTMIKLLTHELVHIKQLYTKQLTVFITKVGDIAKEWDSGKGKWCYYPTTLKEELNHPWEKEAYGIASPKLSFWDKFKYSFLMSFYEGMKKSKIIIPAAAFCVEKQDD